MRVTVGRVGRPHGVRGEVAVWVRTDEPDLRFAAGAAMDAHRDPAGPQERPPSATRLTVAAARWHAGRLVVAFSGVTDRAAAERLTGCWLSVDTSELPETTDPDEFRDHELIGLSVRTTAGEQVGEVADVLHHGQDLLVVRRAGPGNGECLVPFVKAIVPEVDVPAGVLVIDPPRGLLDPAEAEE
ncbi:MAG TPA: ribosome maturation factor RimM [Streptosporangiaceae bacterium]|nr:ribosome maturation factor RimM [Streptosporangiaceae bacterium]